MAGIGNYTKKQKGERGFKMEMKEYGKGKSPFLAGEADSNLTNLAHSAAMANKPGDWSASLNKQYEGINAATAAKGKMGEQIIEGAIEVGGAMIDKKRDKKIEIASAEDATPEQKKKGKKAQYWKDVKGKTNKSKTKSVSEIDAMSDKERKAYVAYIESTKA